MDSGQAVDGDLMNTRTLVLMENLGATQSSPNAMYHYVQSFRVSRRRHFPWLRTDGGCPHPSSWSNLDSGFETGDFEVGDQDVDAHLPLSG